MYPIKKEFYFNPFNLLKKALSLLLCFAIIPFFSVAQKPTRQMDGQKIIIYQLLPRLFGNQNSTNKNFGTLLENGSGKFNDITEKALLGLKELQVNYVWYTGILAHASLTDYTAFGIPLDNAQVVKGRAGSPYAVRDYYDVDPDLAVDVNARMQEFQNLINRTHQQGLKVIIDFIPNHVARNYKSNAKPIGIVDFGAQDNNQVAFSANNDFYYIPGQPLVVPKSSHKINDLSVLQTQNFNENPAKATGNNVFTNQPTLEDWYETVKLNYGIDYTQAEKTYFNPIPPVWLKMRDILIYWTKKGVDGFRCDMAEMVPVAFWNWVIPQVKIENPNLIFIGEAYNPKVYKQYLTEAKFDYLYDKVGLYDGLKKLIKNEPAANTNAIDDVLENETQGFDEKMLRFLENHDEERIASKGFAENPIYALPAMVVSATLGKGPIMLYFGQEVGEPGAGSEGYGGDDNRTTIFDYWGVPNHQAWMNGGLFDGGQLNLAQKNLRAYYQKIMQVITPSAAINKGNIYQIPSAKQSNQKMYAFIRYTAEQRLLIVANFHRTNTAEMTIEIPEFIAKLKSTTIAIDLLSETKLNRPTASSISVKIKPSTAQIIEF